MTDKISRKQKAKNLLKSGNDSISKINAYNNHFLPNGGNDRQFEPIFKSRPKIPTMLPNIKTDHSLHTASSQDTKRLDNHDDHTGRTLMQSPEKITPLQLRNGKASHENETMIP